MHFWSDLALQPVASLDAMAEDEKTPCNLGKGGSVGSDLDYRSVSSSSS